MHRLTSVKEKSNLLDVRRGYIVKQKASFKEKAILWMSSEEHRQKKHPLNRKAIFWRFSTEYCQTENIPSKETIFLQDTFPYKHQYGQISLTLAKLKSNLDKGS